MLVHLCEQTLTCINIKVMDDACTPVWTDPYLYQHQSTAWCLYTWSVNRPLPVSTSKYWMMLVHLECEQTLTCINIKVLHDACTPGVWTVPYLYQHQGTAWCLYTWSVNRPLPVSTSKYWMMLVHLESEQTLTCINIKVLDDACTPGVWIDPYLYQHQSTGWCLYTWSVHRPLPVSTSKYWMMLVHLECEQTLTCINIKVLDDACTPGVWIDPYLYQHQSNGWCLYTCVNRPLPVSTSKYWMMLVHLECEQPLTCINIKVLDDACTPGVWAAPYLYQHQSTGWCLYTWSVSRPFTCINIKVMDDACTLVVPPLQSRSTQTSRYSSEKSNTRCYGNTSLPSNDVMTLYW